ncbi:phage protein Gp27 family protein [Caulobacter segnis]|uniref:Terminase n=1 Tax=Caulobacter segnis TaxID=88688 RepID=A0A2W5X644_9CAUL|nr:phage protein Gp27 family protein [Caulobacter segnis]PZR32281.1 MAG: hypothetical protein DI526_17045 [Caulobacter segnis]
MGRSSVDRLPEGARKSLHEWLGGFQKGELSLDQVMERLGALLEFNGLSEQKPSRSAVHRYAQNFAQVAERVKRSQQFAEMLASEVGPQISDGKGVQVLVQAYTSLAYDMIGNMADEERMAPDALLDFARSIQAAASAQKIDADRALKIEEVALRKAATRVDKTAKALGWSAETAARVRADILGVDPEKMKKPVAT